MKKLGQHFLKNQSAIDVAIDALKMTDKDRVVEIGPGHGELTVPLLAAAANYKDVSILSIEKDHSLIGPLTQLQEKESSGHFEIKEGDALNILPDLVATKIVGNIPYYITGKLLRTIGELEHRPKRTVIMIQKEVAERICATAPEMNRLAASVQFWADASIITHVPRKDFTPPPEVDSAVILLATKQPASEDKLLYYKTVRGIFAQPRKNLVNNIFEMRGKELSKEKIFEFLQKIAIDPEARPQNLNIKEIVAISQIFSL